MLLPFKCLCTRCASVSCLACWRSGNSSPNAFRTREGAVSELRGGDTDWDPDDLRGDSLQTERGAQRKERKEFRFLWRRLGLDVGGNGDNKSGIKCKA